MAVSDEQLADVLIREQSGRDLVDTNPVAALIVESMAASHAQHADRVREAGGFLCELLWPAGDASAAPALTLPVAMHTFVREEHTTPGAMRAYLAQTTRRDLLLGLAASALLRRPRNPHHEDGGAGAAEAVLRTLYLLVRMHETQAETDALEQALYETPDPP